jgi:hypothetical protein
MRMPINRLSLLSLPGVVAALLVLGACWPGASTPLRSPPAPTAAPATPRPTGALRPGFTADAAVFPSAPRYTISLTAAPAQATITGHQEVYYTNAEADPLGSLYLRLFPNTPGYGGAMTVTRVLLGGQPATPTSELAGSALRFDLIPALAPGRSINLTMDFTVTVPTARGAGYAQLGYIDGVMALPNIYPLIPAYDDEGWNVEVAQPYGDAVYSDAAFYSVQVTAPPTMTLIASGTCASPEAGTWSCVAGPMRDFTLVLGQAYDLVTGWRDGVAVNSYYDPEHTETGQFVLSVGLEALALFSDLFGPYPYSEFDLVETPTGAGGIEYPGLVVIGRHLYAGGGHLEWVVVHEVAHQWWYGLVGNDQVDEPWLDEALAQYSTLLYYERTYGPDTAHDILVSNFVRAWENLIQTGDDMPVGLHVGAYPPALYGPVVYQKGPLYFQALRDEVGDEAFLTILRSYLARNRHGVGTPDAFLTAVKIVTGDEQRSLYERWIEGTGGSDTE